MLQQYKEIENLTSSYVVLLGLYRAFYILNWITRYYTEKMYRNWIGWIAGTVQTALYCDFFYYYALRYAVVNIDHSIASVPVVR